MKIAIPDIPEEGLTLDFEEDLSLEDASLRAPVSARLAVHIVGKEIIVSGSMKAALDLRCSRCLKEFSRDIDIPVDVVYHPVEEMASERHELKGDEMDMGFYRGEELDLSELLKEQMLLNIQMKPLCEDNCKGLCPHCGADLNIERCSCPGRETDPRMEVLKNYFEKRKE